MGSCRHKYCLHHAVCTAGGQMQTQVLSSVDCLYSWWAAVDTTTVFSRLSVQLVGSCRHKYCLQQVVCTADGSCRHKYCLQQAVCPVGVWLQTQLLSATGCLYRCLVAVETSTVFSRLSVQVFGSCRNKYCLQ
jgi:hypothetical protein